jgi:hypothetical protein
LTRIAVSEILIESNNQEGNGVSLFTMTFARKLKMLGIAIGLLGIVAAFLDLVGFFADQDKAHLAQLIFHSKGGIPRSTPGFDKFVAAFSPPEGIDEADITHIVKTATKQHDQFPMNIACRYLADMKCTVPVASGEDVRKWADTKLYGVLSWSVAALGWIVVFITEVVEIRRERKEKTT